MTELVPWPKNPELVFIPAVGKVGMSKPPKDDDELLLIPDTQFFALL